MFYRHVRLFSVTHAEISAIVVDNRFCLWSEWRPEEKRMRKREMLKTRKEKPCSESRGKSVQSQKQMRPEETNRRSVFILVQVSLFIKVIVLWRCKPLLTNTKKSAVSTTTTTTKTSEIKRDNTELMNPQVIKSDQWKMISKIILKIVMCPEK